MNEENWETREAYNWLANVDEDTYREAVRVADSSDAEEFESWARETLSAIDMAHAGHAIGGRDLDKIDYATLQSDILGE